MRRTLLAIVLPLALATISMSAVRVADLVVIRHDIEAFRDSAFRSIYAARYARYMQALLKVSFDHLSGRGEGLEAVASTRARLIDTLERLRPFAHEGPSDEPGVSELTAATLGEWEKTQEQVDIYLQRAFAFAQNGEAAHGRRLVMDELNVLVRSRIYYSVDLTIQREQELLEEYRVRIARASEHSLARYVAGVDLRAQLLPDIYEAIQAERFARHAYGDLEKFTHHVLHGAPLDPSHGVAASHAIGRLDQLQRGRLEGEAAKGAGEAMEPGATYALVRDLYGRVMALSPAARRSIAPSVVRRLNEIFDRSLLPALDAIVVAQEQSIEREMARLDQFATGLMVLTIAFAAAALLLCLGCPTMASRLMLRPVDDLLHTVSSFRAGQKDARSTIRPANEIGQLARSLNDLLDELQESDRKVLSLACYDSTTGLPNRPFFEERLSGSLVTARLQGRVMGLLALHLEGLEQVNDTLGREAGDELIRQVAVRVRETVRLRDVVSRQAEGELNTAVSHLGGDEFTILLTRIAKESDAAIAAQRILAKLAEPFAIGEHDIAINTSIGIGVYPQDGGDAQALLRGSSAAMNEAKRKGGNVYQFCSEAMNISNSRKLHIQSRLSTAIERNDLVLHYQPIRRSQDGQLSGAEALLRWTDSEMGPIGPDEFIPIAEQAGLIEKIGRWVIDAACSQIHEWQEAGYPSLRMSVNVSASQLRDPDWVESVEETLEEYGLSASCLDLEITETTMIGDEPKTIAALTRLSEMGVGIVLDDFGTGYSSLSHLSRLPISRVKIDRAFVSEISAGEAGAALAGGIIALAHGLRLGVVAEGVETHEQANFLRSRGCDELQGYLLSRPVPAPEFESFMTREKTE